MKGPAWVVWASVNAGEYEVPIAAFAVPGMADVFLQQQSEIHGANFGGAWIKYTEDVRSVIDYSLDRRPRKEG